MYLYINIKHVFLFTIHILPSFAFTTRKEIPVIVNVRFVELQAARRGGGGSVMVAGEWKAVSIGSGERERELLLYVFRTSCTEECNKHIRRF